MKKSEKIKSKNQISTRSKNGLGFYIFPIIFAVIVVPLIVRLKVFPLDDRVYLLWNGNDSNIDFFSYYKAIALMGVSTIMILIYFWNWNKKKALISSRKPYYFLIILFLFLIVFSSIFSSYSYLSISGAPDRYEGMYVWISYFLVFLYTMNYEYEEKTSRILIYSIYLFIVLIGIIGLSQYIGKDLFESEFFKLLMIPKEYQKYSDSFSAGDYGMRTIYGTAYHYNYMGSLASMLFAFSFVMAWLYEDQKMRFLSAGSAMISLFLLFGSNARSGLVALMVFALVILLFFWRKIVAARRLFVVGGIIFTCLVAIFLMSNQEFLHRLPSLISDVRVAFSSETAERDHYRQDIFLKSVRIDERDILIETMDYSIRYRPDQDTFYDEKNKCDISYYKDKDSVWHLAEPYQKIGLSFFQDQKNDHRYIKFDDGKIQLYFKQTKENVTATNPNGMEISLDEAPAIGFIGKEKLGSSRGYIWSRTMPLLSKAIFLGYGADTFLAIFPQGDIYAKLYAYDSIWMLVDKPHNLYLQMAINFGVLFVILFVVLIFFLGIRFFRKYQSKMELDRKDVFAVACFMSVVSYLAAGFFNDSILSVAPIFWVLLGFSIALSEEI